MTTFPLDTLCKILVVSDTPDGLQILFGALRERRYEVCEIGDCKGVMAAVITESPALILLDIINSKTDLFEICSELKADVRTQYIPIMCLGFRGEVSHKIKAFSVGVVDYISKPFDIEEAIVRIENQLKIGQISKKLIDVNTQLQQQLQEIQDWKAHPQEIQKNGLSCPLTVESSPSSSSAFFKPLLAPNSPFVQPGLIVSPDTLVSEAIAQMSQGRTSCALVVDRHQLVGIFTERDIVRITANKLTLHKITVRQIMTPNPITISASQAIDIFSILNLLRQHKIRHLPVVDESGQVLGAIAQNSIREILKPTDLLKFQAISQVMSTNVVHAPPTTSLLEITQIMTAHSISCVAIAEVKNGSDIIPIGIITERDIVQFRVLELDLLSTQAQAVMSYPILPIKASDSLWNAHQMMERHRIRRLIVVSEAGTLVGIVTQSTLLATLDPIELFSTLEVLRQQADRRVIQLNEVNERLQQEIAIREQELQERLLLERQLKDQNAWLQAEIRERIRVQETLVKREREFRTLAENSPDIILRLDRQFRYLYTNPIAERLSGISTIERFGKTNRELGFPEALVEEWEAIMKLVFETGTQQTMEYEVSTYAGTKHFLFRVVPEFGNQGEVESILAIARDISDRKQIEEALRLIVEGTASSTGEHFFYSCTRYLAEVLQVRYALIAELVDRTQTKARTLAWWAGDAHGENFEYDLTGTPCELVFQGQQCLFPNSVQAIFPEDPYLVELNAHSYLGIPLLDSSGKILGLLAVLDERHLEPNAGQEMILQIFTARVGAELERKKAEEALAKSQRFIQRITDSSPNFLYIFDFFEQHLIYSNRSLGEMLGYTPEQSQAMGKSLLQTLIHPEDFAKIPERMQQYARHKEGTIFEQEYRLLDSQGEWRTFWVREIVFAKTFEGKVQQTLGTATDITDRKQAEVALEQQLRREQLVASIQERIRSSLDLEEILNTAVAEVRQFLLTDRVLIYRLSPDGTRRAAVESVEPGWPTVLGQTFPEEIFTPESQQQYSQGEVFILEDVDRANVSPPLANFFNSFRVKAKLVVPILKDTELWGLLLAHHCQGPRQWHASEIESLRQIAVQLAIALQQSTLFEQAKAEISERKKAEESLRESAERERALAAAIQRIRQSLDLGTIFAATTEELRSCIDCDRVAIYQFNPDYSGKFVAESVINPKFSLLHRDNNQLQLTPAEISQSCRLQPLLNTYPGWSDTYLIQTQASSFNQETTCLVIEDIYQSGLNGCYLERLEQFQIRAYIIVPIFCGCKLWGLLAVYQSSAPRRWKTEESSIVVQISNQLGVALQQSELLEQTKQQSEALQKSAIAAEAANRAKSDFLANMSHELRTPLNAILGFAQVMSADPSLKPENQQQLAIINRAGAHLLELINDILEMSKIEAGRTTLTPTDFDLIHLLNTLREMLHLRASSKGLTLRFEISSDTPQFIRADDGKLRQILINILGNAIKFTEQGHVTLRVKRGVKIDENNPKIQSLLFEVEDTGFGIASEEIGNLFQAFSQTEAGRRFQQGTGLGLPISKKFVQLMGGDITVSSTLGQGSIFSFDIQVQEISAATVKVPVSQRKVIRLAPDRGNYRILVVDDRLESRVLLDRLLTQVGFEVQEAENGLHAIELWNQWEPHLIIMDMRMPVMDGFEATKRIKSHLKGQATAIIALTASAFEEDRSMVLSAGCDDFVRKPFQREELLEKIGQHLGVQYLYEELIPNSTTIAANEMTASEDLSWHLAQMPSAWVTAVHELASRCIDEKIFELLTEIPPQHEPLARTLADLVRDFQFHKILDLIDNANSVG